MLKRKKKTFTFQGLGTSGDFVEQIKNLNKTLLTKKGREAATMLLNLGWLYDQWALISSTKQKEVYQRKAKVYFREALHRGAYRWLVFNGLGTVELHQGNYKKALSYYRQMHILHRSSLSYNALGNVYRQLGKLSVAKRNYEYALRLSKHPIEKSSAMYNLSQLKKETSNNH